MILEEDQLIKRCKKYDSKAQQELYNLYRKKMFGICLQYASYEDAKDLFQEGFIKIFTSIKQYEGTGSLEGWMRRVMVNNILTEFRKRKKIHFENLELLPSTKEVEEDDTANTIEEVLLNDLDEKDILNSLDMLPADMKIVFNLFCTEGYSHKEIASALSITESNSRLRLLRARKALQVHFTLLYKEKNKLTLAK